MGQTKEIQSKDEIRVYFLSKKSSPSIREMLTGLTDSEQTRAKQYLNEDALWGFVSGRYILKTIF
jgi:hypothetical protein